jgi:hypothetical protein
MSLEELILRHAVGMDIPSFERTQGASGVMMIPIPRGGILRGWDGVDEALAVSGIVGVEITAKKNYPIVPLPEGSSYLGFIFARGESPDEVEAAIRVAHSKLRFQISSVISMSVG